MHNCCYHVPMQSQLFIAEFIAPILWQRREKKCINIGHRTGFGSVLVCQPQLSLFEGISLRVATVRRGNKKSTVVKTTGSPVNLTPLEDEGIRSSSRKRRHFFLFPRFPSQNPFGREKCSHEAHEFNLRRLSPTLGKTDFSTDFKQPFSENSLTQRRSCWGH